MKGSGACILNAIPDVMMAFVGSCFVMQFVLPLEVIFSKHVCLKKGNILPKLGRATSATGCMGTGRGEVPGTCRQSSLLTNYQVTLWLIT